jgi:signal transduction histidine kinase
MPPQRAFRTGPPRRAGHTIPDMAGSVGASHPAGFLPGWARWAALAVFAALVVVGLLPMSPDPPAAAVAAAAAIGAGVLLVQQRRPLLAYAAVATAAVAVLGHGTSTNIAWFTVCLIGIWCALAGERRDAIAYWAGALLLFAAEWLWILDDPGWAAWMAGVTLSVILGLLIRHQIDLVAQLREAQAGLAERSRAEERNRIGRELHDVIAHTLTVSLLHITSARLAVEHDPADAARALAEAERLGRESLDEVRLAVGTLHEHADGGRTTPLPGVDGLPALVERFRSAGADVSLTVDGDTGRLHATTGLAVYRILQEALTNAVKHAPGAPTSATLTVDADAVRLAVDSAADPGAGTGLGVVSMRERAESLGGKCQAGPGGRGWLVAATLPLGASRRPEAAT